MYLQLLVLLLVLPACLQYYIEKAVDVCEWDIYDCYTPYDIEVTEMFRCNYNDCPVNFKCCSHRCFRHNICQPYREITPEPQRISSNGMTKPGQCDILLSCDINLPESFIKRFECLHDDGCPDHFKCCYIDCYAIKVCQPAKNEHMFGYYTSASTVKVTSTKSLPEYNLQTTATLIDDTNGDQTVIYTKTPTEERSTSTKPQVSHSQETTSIVDDTNYDDTEIYTRSSTEERATSRSPQVSHSQRTTSMDDNDDDDIFSSGDAQTEISTTQKVNQTLKTTTIIVVDDEINTTDTILIENTNTQTTTGKVINSEITAKTMTEDDIDDDMIFSGDIDDEDDSFEGSGSETGTYFRSTNVILNETPSTMSELETAATDVVGTPTTFSAILTPNLSSQSTEHTILETLTEETANSEGSQSQTVTYLPSENVINTTETHNVQPNLVVTTTIIPPTKMVSNSTLSVSLDIINESSLPSSNTDETTNHTESVAIINIVPLTTNHIDTVGRENDEINLDKSSTTNMEQETTLNSLEDSDNETKFTVTATENSAVSSPINELGTTDIFVIEKPTTSSSALTLNLSEQTTIQTNGKVTNEAKLPSRNTDETTISTESSRVAVTSNTPINTNNTVTNAVVKPFEPVTEQELAKPDGVEKPTTSSFGLTSTAPRSTDQTSTISEIKLLPSTDIDNTENYTESDKEDDTATGGNVNVKKDVIGPSVLATKHESNKRNIYESEFSESDEERLERSGLIGKIAYELNFPSLN